MIYNELNGILIEFLNFDLTVSVSVSITKQNPGGC